MKDMPAALLVVLSKRDTALLHRVFDRVVDNGRVLRTRVPDGPLGPVRPQEPVVDRCSGRSSAG